jgi:hypothetical protein
MAVFLIWQTPLPLLLSSSNLLPSWYLPLPLWICICFLSCHLHLVIIKYILPYLSYQAQQNCTSFRPPSSKGSFLWRSAYQSLLTVLLTNCADDFANLHKGSNFRHFCRKTQRVQLWHHKCPALSPRLKRINWDLNLFLQYPPCPQSNLTNTGLYEVIGGSKRQNPVTQFRHLIAKQQSKLITACVHCRMYVLLSRAPVAVIPELP